MAIKHLISDKAFDILASQNTPETIIEKLREIKNTPPVPDEEAALRAYLNEKLADEFNADPSLEQKIMDSTKVSEQTATDGNNSNGGQGQGDDLPNSVDAETPPPAVSKQWVHSLTILTIGVAILVIFSILWCNCNNPDLKCFSSTTLIPLSIIFVVVLIIAFLYLFTGETSEGKMRGMFIFCYFITFAAILASIAPFVLYNDAKHININNHMQGSPIGIFKGCSRQIEDAPDGGIGVPHEIRCENNSDQWIVNVGGRVIGVNTGYILNDESIREINNILKNKKIEFSKESLKDHSIREYSDRGRFEENLPDTIKHKDINVSYSDLDEGIKKKIFSKLPVAKLGEVQGGLVVPLYFIVLALIGAAISMTRRIPEFQKRVVTDKADRVTKERAREMLVFQIMQFVSAPIIAVTAYYLLDPGSRKFTVALGFTAGFASETILIMIRAIVDKLKPTIESVDDEEAGVDDLIPQVEEKKKAKAELDEAIKSLKEELNKLTTDKADQKDIDAKDKEIKDKEKSAKAIATEIQSLTNEINAILKAKGIN